MRHITYKMGIFAGLAAAILLAGAKMDGEAATPTLEAGSEVVVLEDKREEKEREGCQEGGQPLAVQLGEVLALESQLELRQDAGEQERMRARYEELLVQAVTGGYDKARGIGNRYATDKGKGSVLDERMADYYRDFIHANGNSRTAEILEKYLQVLEENEFQIDTDVEEFYQELPELVRKWSYLERGDLQYWLWKVGITDLFE